MSILAEIKNNAPALLKNMPIEVVYLRYCLDVWETSAEWLEICFKYQAWQFSMKVVIVESALLMKIDLTWFYLPESHCMNPVYTMRHSSCSVIREASEFGEILVVAAERAVRCNYD